MQILAYPGCSTCQATIKELEKRGTAFVYRNIKENNPSIEELTEWYRLSGLPLKKFFNTSGVLYKSLQLKEKLPQMSEQEQIELLASHGMLIKRPLAIEGKHIALGKREILSAFWSMS